MVLVPARGATAVCADRRFFDDNGKQFDSDDKLQLLSPHAAWFVVGLEAVFTHDKDALCAGGGVFSRFLAERAAAGVPAESAMHDSAGTQPTYLREDFEGFLKDHPVVFSRAPVHEGRNRSCFWAGNRRNRTS